MDHPPESFGYITGIEDLECLPNDCLDIYTDGSKIEGKVGAAATFFRNGGETHRMGMGLARYCTVYQAEMLGILGAITRVQQRKMEGPINILSVSRASLETIGNPNSDNPMAHEIKKLVKERERNGLTTEFFWIEAHVGIPGNERADELARDAALKRSIPGESIEEWQRRYEGAKTGATTRLFFADVGVARKMLASTSMTNAKAQLLTGHSGVRQYLHRFGLAASPYCVCDDESVESIPHVLLTCPRFGRERLDCEQAMVER
ncbi:hypothetical protein MSG28_012905 [Choristoneura fumiferana]|uniref:Uncharacterized protein n=1 Tax=Choristoneura fumiferana TaxID=7141 RepID=A0ACC0JII1_CHOFU|nr:hypothetical protein MSG28_012905 [Choristoneura fumiferana]